MFIMFFWFVKELGVDQMFAYLYYTAGDSGDKP